MGTHYGGMPYYRKLKNIRPAFEAYEGNKEDLPPVYQQIKCHMIFDIKLGNTFRRKAQLVGGGHTTTSPSSITFSSVVSRDSVRIALTITSFNELGVLACDIQNAYLTAISRENIWTFVGPQLGEEEVPLMLCKNGIIWTKVIGRSITIQARISTEVHWSPFHKRGSQYMDPTSSKTRWHRIPRNGIMIC